MSDIGPEEEEFEVWTLPEPDFNLEPIVPDSVPLPEPEWLPTETPLEVTA